MIYIESEEYTPPKPTVALPVTTVDPVVYIESEPYVDPTAAVAQQEDDWGGEDKKVVEDITFIRSEQHVPHAEPEQVAVEGAERDDAVFIQSDPYEMPKPAATMTPSAKYLQQHNIKRLLSAAVAALLKDEPADAQVFLSDFIKQGVKV